MKVNVGTNANSLEQLNTAQAGASASNAAGKAVDAKPASVTQAASQSTTTTISNQFKAIQSSLGAGSTFDTDKVNALKSAIDSGNYSVDAGKIANGLIAAATSFLK